MGSVQGSPLCESFLEKLSALGEGCAIHVNYDDFDLTHFGGATSFRITVDCMRLTVDTRDPKSEPPEIELSYGDSIDTVWASYLVAFLEQIPAELVCSPSADLIDHLIQHWDSAYAVVCSDVENSAFTQYSIVAKEFRDAAMIDKFRQARQSKCQ